MRIALLLLTFWISQGASANEMSQCTVEAQQAAMAIARINGDTSISPKDEVAAETSEIGLHNSHKFYRYKNNQKQQGYYAVDTLKPLTGGPCLVEGVGLSGVFDL